MNDLFGSELQYVVHVKLKQIHNKETVRKKRTSLPKPWLRVEYLNNAKMQLIHVQVPSLKTYFRNIFFNFNFFLKKDKRLNWLYMYYVFK